jgi:hypothetical protein
MATSFSGGGSWSIRKEPPTMGTIYTTLMHITVTKANILNVRKGAWMAQ